MGGGLCLHTLRYTLPEKVVGVFCISSFAVNSSILYSGTLSKTLQLPILMMHGIFTLFLSLSELTMLKGLQMV